MLLNLLLTYSQLTFIINTWPWCTVFNSLLSHLSCCCHLFPSTKLATCVLCLVDLRLSMILASSIAGTNPSFASPINMSWRKFLWHWRNPKPKEPDQDNTLMCLQPQIPLDPVAASVHCRFHKPNHHWIPFTLLENM